MPDVPLADGSVRDAQLTKPAPPAADPPPNDVPAADLPDGTSPVRRAGTPAPAPTPRADAAWAAARRFGAGLRRAGRTSTRRWRRSLQLRVVATTLVASGLVVALLGLVLLHEISTGLLDAQRNAAVSEATSGLSQARLQLSALGNADDSTVERSSSSLVNSLQSRGGNAGLFGVYLTLPPGSSTQDRAVLTGEVQEDSVPFSLRQLVRLGSQGYQYVTLHPPRQNSEPGLIVGGQVDSPTGAFELYFVFSLQTQVATINLVQRTLLLSGFVLVLLLGAVAGIVTRQVVTPVRLAVRTAEQLAAGVLTERLRVRGEDDLARLAVSFNEMADSLQREIGALEELSRMQRRFTSDVSHELRTPLTTVRMAADMLHASRADFEPAVARSAELLQHEVDRFEELLTDLLEISRYDAGVARLEPEPTDLVALARRAVDGMSGLADRTGSELEVLPPTDPVVAEMDPRRIERVIRNLLGNAADHGAGRPVQIQVGGDDDAVALTVRDHGIGLRPGESALVFNRFWRADPSRARQTGGTGLGLSISLEDTRLHGGWLQAWGEPGEGACFRLTLPRRAGDALSRSPLPLVPEPADRL